MTKFRKMNRHLGPVQKLDSRGAALIEFAFAMPIIFGLMFGSIELGYQAVAKTALETAVTAAAREAITGAIAIPGKTREEVIQWRIRDAMSSFKFIPIIIVPGHPEQGNPRIMVSSYASMADGGGFGTVRQAEPMNDYNADGTCNTGNVIDSVSGTTKRETFNDANGNNAWDPANSNSGAGGPGQIVSYDVAVDSKLLFGNFFHMATKASAIGGNPDMLTLESQAVVQNEVFAIAASDGDIQKYCDGTKA
jgi:TadE-like protein